MYYFGLKEVESEKRRHHLEALGENYACLTGAGISAVSDVMLDSLTISKKLQPFQMSFIKFPNCDKIPQNPAKYKNTFHKHKLIKNIIKCQHFKTRPTIKDRT